MTTQPTPTPNKKVWLRWTGSGMEYQGGAEEGLPIVLDAKTHNGPGPMDALLLAVAGCMAVDVQVILERSRVDLTGMDVQVEGTRAQTHPKRYTGILIRFLLQGPQEKDEGKVQRAIDLSQEKFCSVVHSLNPDISLEIQFQLV